MVIPIWKDTEYTTSADTLNYKISVDNQTIFSAKAYKYPNAENLKINVNKICQDYLKLELPDLRSVTATTVYTNSDALREFALSNSAGTSLATYRFIYNWDYELNRFDASSSSTFTSVLSSPINGHAANNQIVCQTIYNKRVTSTIMRNVKTTIANAQSDSSLGYTTGYCGDYALIYSNSHGGFDSFLIEGNTKVSDDIESQEYNKPYNNTTIDFEKKRYISEITTSMEMHTGWLTDEQSDNLATNLIPTNYLYVQDLRTNQFYPALIKDTSVEHKQFKNGRKLNAYTINVELSQTKLRK